MYNHNLLLILHLYYRSKIKQVYNDILILNNIYNMEGLSLVNLVGSKI